jgi:hypothetical protein
MKYDGWLYFALVVSVNYETENLAHPRHLPSRYWDQTIQAAVTSSMESNRVYGYRKVYHDLLAAGWHCCDQTIRRIMADLGVAAEGQVEVLKLQLMGALLAIHPVFSCCKWFCLFSAKSIRLPQDR